MTRITCRRSVSESLNTLVIPGNLRLVTMLMAIDTAKCRVISRIDMTIRAGRPDALMVCAGIDREPGVIKCRAGPSRCGVARRAGGWEAGSDVVRSRGIVIVRVARVAICRQAAGVVIIDVAQGAGDRRVRTRQRERGVVVIKR